MAVEAGVVASLRAKFEAVLPHLDERQQRLVMAGEARSLGHGGIAAVASATGASRSRISAGVAELESGQAPLRLHSCIGYTPLGSAVIGSSWIRTSCGYIISIAA